MQGITKGTLLGDRYELTSQSSDAPGLARWVAQDEKLGREVAITIFPSNSSHAEAALDSARRAAGVDEQRLVRVLDAGSDSGNSYIVSEAHTGAHSLADLARFEQMHPEEARRIIGETALALEAARQRGLHHLILDPTHVLRLADGSIVVTQIAVGGALAGRDGLSSAEATKSDTLALIRLLYLALTGLWPGPELGLKGIERAERRADGQLPTPHELVDGVPGDLDALCRQALNYNEGPRTPGEVGRQLAPWSAQMITAPGKPRRSTPLADDAPPPSSRDDDGYIVRRADDASRSKRTGVGAVGAAALAAASADETTSAPAREPASPRKDVTDPNVRAGASNTSDHADQRGEQYEDDVTSTYAVDEADAAYSRTHSGYDPSFEELEPPIPGFNSGTDDPDSRTSRIALSIVALFVIAALVLAFFGLRNIGGGSKKPVTAASQSSKPSTKSSASASASPSPSSTGTPVQILGTSVVNSYGYRVTDSNTAFQATDGDVNTEWTSLHYLDKPWGGFKNYGGLAIKLNGSSSVKQIKITPGKEAPLTADVYVGDVPGTSGTKVGSVTNATTEQTVNSTASGLYVTIFVTTMAKPSGEDYYQAAVSEVSVSK